MFERRDIKTSAFWRIIEVVGAEFFAFCSFLVLTRMLAPEHFGVVTLATMLIMVSQLILHQGVGEALVQRDKIEGDCFSSALWMNVVFASIAALILILTSEWIALGFSEPRFGPVLRGIAPILLIYAASGILQAKLRRELRLKGFAYASIFGTICGAVVASLMAFKGFGVWSLIGQQWTYAIVSTFMFFLCADWIPRLFVSKDHIRQLAGFSFNAVGAALLRLSLRQADLLFLGVHLPSKQVGLYFLASRLLYTIGQLTYYSIQKISLPVLSRLQNDMDRHQAAIISTFRLTCLICLPIFFGMATTADLAIPIVFGTEWAGSIQAFWILCVFGVFYALSLIASQVLLSIGLASIVFRLSVVTAVVFVIAVAAAAPFGIAATALAGGLANMLTLPAYFFALRRWLNVDLIDLGIELLPIWTAVTAMVIFIVAARYYVLNDFHPLATLTLSVILGVVLFSSTIAFLRRDYADDFLTTIIGERHRSNPS